MASKKKGPLRISDRSLMGARENLFALFDAHWPCVGWRLENLASAHDVYAALAPAHHDDSQYVMRHLLRKDLEVGPFPDPRIWERRLKKIQNALDELHKHIALTEEHLRQVIPCLTPSKPENAAKTEVEKSEHSAEELEILRSEEVRLKRVLGEYQSRQTQLKQEYVQVKGQLEAGCVFFAKFELVEFCSSHRNRLNPRRVANALAGLPRVGWRQSANRCVNLETSKTPGQYRYFVFRIIRKFVYSWDRKSDLCTHIESRLKGSARSPVRLWKDLGSNWRHLRKAIESTANDSHGESRSYAIACEYFRLVMQPKSERETTLVRLQRIDVKIKSRKKKSGSPSVDAGDKP